MNHICKHSFYAIFFLYVVSNFNIYSFTSPSVAPNVHHLSKAKSEMYLPCISKGENISESNQKEIVTAQILSQRIWDEWWFRISMLLVVSYVLYMSRKNKLASVEKHYKDQEAFARKLIETEEIERERIARDLHDGLGQNLIVIKNMLLSKTHQPQIECKKLVEVTDLIDQSLLEIRSISHNLHPHLLHQLGLSKTLKSLVNQVNEFSDIRISEAIDDLNNLLDPKEEINLFRIIQEILNNIIKHSQAKNAEIVIKCSPDSIKVLIRDNGVGMGQMDIQKHEEFEHGFGLYGLKKRTQLFNWDYKMTSTPGVETEISLIIPLKKGETWK